MMMKFGESLAKDAKTENVNRGKEERNLFME
jgi:hypothetical protein